MNAPRQLSLFKILTVFAFILLSFASSEAQVYVFTQTFTSSFPTITLPSGVSGNYGIQNDRLNRYGYVATCSNKIQYSNHGSGTYDFQSFTFTNTNSSNLCITVAIANQSPSGLPLFTSLYSSAFDPTAIYQNWIANAATSTGLLTTQSFSGVVPSNSNFVVVVNDISSTTGTVYNLTVSGVVTSEDTCRYPIITYYTPSNVTLNYGQSTTLSVGAQGSNLTYQWYESTYTPNSYIGIGYGSSITVSKSGRYFCDVFSACGQNGYVSSTGFIYVNTICTPTLSISEQPTPTTTITAGQFATLSVTAIGNGVYNYWNNSEYNTTYSSILTTSVAGSYIAIVYDACGNFLLSDSATVVVPNTLTDIKGILSENGSITVFPNPAKDYITVQANNYDKIEFLKSTGERISSYPLSGRLTIPLSDYSSGLYFMKFYNGDYSVIKKLIIE